MQVRKLKNVVYRNYSKTCLLLLHEHKHINQNARINMEINMYSKQANKTCQLKNKSNQSM